MALLFIAAEARELKPFAAHLTGLRPLKWPIDYAQEGILDGRRILLAANGAGPKLAAHALEIAIRAISAADLQSSRLEAVISVGLCGALDPALREGQIIVATQVCTPASEELFPACPVEAEQPFVSGVFVSQDRIATTTDEKAQLRQRCSASAVEMESFGIAVRAKRANLPFCCIKVISDRADESFKLDFNQSRSKEGRISRGKIVLKVVAQPGVIPELFRLRRRAEWASGALGDFLVSCRFNIQSAGNVIEVDNSTDAG